MITFKVKDDHPGKWQDGIELFLVDVLDKTDPFGKTIFTGFRVDPKDCRGLFTKTTEPVQCLKYKFDGWHFTMSNLTDISVEDVEKVRRGEIVQVHKYKLRRVEETWTS